MRALQAGLDLDFFLFFSLPGASDFPSESWQLNGGSGVRDCDGEAIEERGLNVEVAEVKDPGEDTIGRKFPPGLAVGPATD